MADGTDVKMEGETGTPRKVKVGETPDSAYSVEIATEINGTLLLSAVTNEFPEAVGLRFKTAAGGWRGVRCRNSILDVPIEGWGDFQYAIVRQDGKVKSGTKRKANGETAEDKLVRISKEIRERKQLIMLGLPYNANERELKTYFEKYGEVTQFVLKKDDYNMPKGFGFVFYKTYEACEKVIKEDHVIRNKKVDVRYPADKPKKLFIGGLPSDATVEHIDKHFSKYCPVRYSYIPDPFQGFGFVMLSSSLAANEIIKSRQALNGRLVNISEPTKKHGEMDEMSGAPNEGFEDHYDDGSGDLHWSNHPGIRATMRGGRGGFHGNMWEGNHRPYNPNGNPMVWNRWRGPGPRPGPRPGPGMLGPRPGPGMLGPRPNMPRRSMLHPNMTGPNMHGNGAPFKGEDNVRFNIAREWYKMQHGSGMQVPILPVTKKSDYVWTGSTTKIKTEDTAGKN